MSKVTSILPDGTLKVMRYAWVCTKCLQDNGANDVCSCGGERTDVLTEQARLFREALIKAQRTF
jgi:hypothetical protein